MSKTLEERTKAFQEGMEKLMKETEVGLKPQITGDGPTVTLVDMAPKPEVKEEKKEVTK